MFWDHISLWEQLVFLGNILSLFFLLQNCIMQKKNNNNKHFRKMYCNVCNKHSYSMVIQKSTFIISYILRLLPKSYSSKSMFMGYSHFNQIFFYITCLVGIKYDFWPLCTTPDNLPGYNGAAWETKPRPAEPTSPEATPHPAATYCIEGARVCITAASRLLSPVWCRSTDPAHC